MARKSPWERLPARTSSGAIHVVVETPRGSQNKYKFDPKLGVFRLNRVLFSGAAFPFDFGFVAGTRSADGDPLDAMLLVDAPTFSGCVVRARPIGVLLAHKTGVPNHRIVAVPLVAKPYATYRDIADVPMAKLGEFDQFFRAVLNVDGGEHRLDGFAGRAEAEAIVTACVARKKSEAIRALAKTTKGIAKGRVPAAPRGRAKKLASHCGQPDETSSAGYAIQPKRFEPVFETMKP